MQAQSGGRGWSGRKNRRGVRVREGGWTYGWMSGKRRLQRTEHRQGTEGMGERKKERWINSQSEGGGGGGGGHGWERRRVLREALCLSVFRMYCTVDLSVNVISCASLTIACHRQAQTHIKTQKY